MLRRSSGSHSPQRLQEPEEPKLRWRNIRGQLATMQQNIDKVQARLKHYSGLIAAHKGKLAGDNDSLSLDKVSRIAKQFRSDTREYTAALEVVLDDLEQGNIAMWTAHNNNNNSNEQEGGSGLAEATSSEEELVQQQRVSLSRLVVDHWLRFRQAHAAILRANSLESSRRQSDLGIGKAPEKRKRKLWFKPMKMVSQDEKSKEEEADEESGALTEDNEVPLGLTDKSRGVPDGTSSSGDGGLGVPSSRRGVGRSSSEDGVVGAASSGGSGAGGSAASGDKGAACEKRPGGEGSADPEESPSKASMTQYTSATSTSLKSFHSATSGDEADCEPETTTTPVASTTTDSSNGNGNSESSGNGNGNGIPNGKVNANGEGNIDVNGNGNAISNGQVGMQSTASQTDESWIALDCVELGQLNKESWSVRHEVCRQHSLLRLMLQHHVQRLESLRLVRLHLLSQTQPLRASRLLRVQLLDALCTVASELRAAQDSLRVRASALRLLAPSLPCSQLPQQLPPKATDQQLSAEAAATTTSQPIQPPPLETRQQQMQTEAAAASQPDPSPTLKNFYQQLLVEAAAVTVTAISETVPNRPPHGNVLHRTIDFLLRFSNRQ